MVVVVEGRGEVWNCCIMEGVGAGGVSGRKCVVVKDRGGKLE